MNGLQTVFQQDGLWVKVDSSAPNVVISWTGISDILHPDQQLGTFLTALLPTLRGKTVKIDLCKFNYMNSATFGPLLQFIKELDRHAIPVLLVFNNQQQWQRLMFQCMKTIARTLSSVQVQSL